MEYLTTIKFEGIFIPIYLDDLNGQAYAVATNLFSHYHNLKSKYQIVLSRELFNKDEDFINYVFNHELGHIHLYLKLEKEGKDLCNVGLINHELYADMYSLKSMGKYNIEFIDSLYKHEDPYTEVAFEQRILCKYMKLFIKHNIYNNIDDVLKIDFRGIF